MSRYIDVDKMISIIRSYISDTSNLHNDALEIAECCNNAYENIIDELNDLPTEDVKHIVYGEWIDVGLYVYECSNCYNSLEMWWEDKYKFCPNCGARMKGEQTE